MKHLILAVCTLPLLSLSGCHEPGRVGPTVEIEPRAASESEPQAEGPAKGPSEAPAEESAEEPVQKKRWQQEPISDFNGNGIDDGIDITDGTSLDENLNGIPDEAEVN